MQKYINWYLDLMGLMAETMIKEGTSRNQRIRVVSTTGENVHGRTVNMHTLVPFARVPTQLRHAKTPGKRTMINDSLQTRSQLCVFQKV